MRKRLIFGVVMTAVLVLAIIISLKIDRKVQLVTSSQALTRLKEGNARFLDEKRKAPKQSASRRKETARYGQNPYAIVLACSDSRVPVEIIFDEGVGDIFVVSNAGNIAQDDIVAGTIEYAAKHLKSPLLVILGHTKCGAVQAALSETPAAGNIRVIQKIIEPAAAEARKEHPQLKGPELLHEVIEANVMQSKTDLLARSKIIKGMYEKGSLEIVTAVYDIETGKVEWEE